MNYKLSDYVTPQHNPNQIQEQARHLKARQAAKYLIHRAEHPSSKLTIDTLKTIADTIRDQDGDMFRALINRIGEQSEQYNPFNSPRSWGMLGYYLHTEIRNTQQTDADVINLFEGLA